MIIVTGAAGFIGSCLVSKLNQAGFNNVVVVDDFTKHEKDKNLEGKIFEAKVERGVLADWLATNQKQIDIIFHIGARTDTTEFDKAIFDALNVEYTQMLWNFCADHSIPLVYASSAATYGLGEFGYEDNHEVIAKLKPLNPYGDSKNDFDIWALQQEKQPPFWAGLKFFNVYGPNEYHKARMASVVYHAYHQIKKTGAVNLFQSHREDYAHGTQMRDFIYVKDLCEVCLFLMHHRKNSGLYNLGSGQARTWNDLAQAIFAALQLPVQVNYIPIPEDIRVAYQYFTEATMHKMRQIGYVKPFTTIEEGIADYVNNYLEPAAWR